MSESRDIVPESRELEPESRDLVPRVTRPCTWATRLWASSHETLSHKSRDLVPESGVLVSALRALAPDHKSVSRVFWRVLHRNVLEIEWYSQPPDGCSIFWNWTSTGCLGGLMGKIVRESAIDTKLSKSLGIVWVVLPIEDRSWPLPKKTAMYLTFVFGSLKSIATNIELALLPACVFLLSQSLLSIPVE